MKLFLISSPRPPSPSPHHPRQTYPSSCVTARVTSPSQFIQDRSVAQNVGLLVRKPGHPGKQGHLVPLMALITLF